jgi:hypothetical protein
MAPPTKLKPAVDPPNNREGAAAVPAAKVTVPAAKLPDESRATMVEGVLEEVAVVLLLLIGPVIFTSVTAPSASLAVVTLASARRAVVMLAAVMSAVTIKEEVTTDPEEECRTPVPKADPREKANALPKLIWSAPPTKENPAVVPPRRSDGAAAVPAGNCKGPAMAWIPVAVKDTLPVADPFKVAVMMLAEKLPDVSRETIDATPGVKAEEAVVLLLLIGPVILTSVTAPSAKRAVVILAAVISEVTIKEDVTTDPELL